MVGSVCVRQHINLSKKVAGVSPATFFVGDVNFVRLFYKFLMKRQFFAKIFQKKRKTFQKRFAFTK